MTKLLTQRIVISTPANDVSDEEVEAVMDRLHELLESALEQFEDELNNTIECRFHFDVYCE